MPPSDAPVPPATGAHLGPGLTPAPFVPGRYATAIQRSLTGTHELQLVREVSTASLVLELDRDGAARACRGWRYLMTNDGPEVQSEDRFREQAGFRGRHRVDGDAIEVELTADPSVCPTVAEHMLAPARASRWILRCVRATPDGHPTLRAPVLVCTWTGPASPERDAHVVDGLGPAGTIVLGAAPGLRVKLEGGVPGLVGEPAKVTAETATVAADAWQTPF